MTNAKCTKGKRRLQRRATTVQKSIKNVMPGHKGSVRKSTVVAGTGFLVAAAAGAAVAARLRRKGSFDGATFHVSRDDDGWALRSEGSDDPIQTFQTKASAVRAARKAAADSAPSDLMIHLADGTIQATHSYPLH